MQANCDGRIDTLQEARASADSSTRVLLYVRRCFPRRAVAITILTFSSAEYCPRTASLISRTIYLL
jgi:hypothetical protein